MFPYFRFQLHRRWRRLRRNSRIYRAWLVNYFYRHIWGKWRQLGIIRRFIAVWWGLAIVILVSVLNQGSGLQGIYLGKSPVAGGVYTEAVVGEVKGINPILPDNAATADASRLVFSGLTRLNPSGQIEPELAQSWKISDNGLRYTFELRKDLKWHDGVTLTAGDVAFTIAAIQHPDSRSPLAAEWRGVKVTAESQRKVVFTLPNPYVGFIQLTTVGILPQHLLESINPTTLRVVSFNQNPIGSGPFKIKEFTPGQKAVFEANANYFRGRPKLDGFVIKFFKNDRAAIDAFAKKQVNAISRIDIEQFEIAAKIKDLKMLRYRTTEQVDLFLNNTDQKLSDPNVRQALVYATDKRSIVQNSLDNFAQPLGAPILPGQLGFAGRFNQPHYNQHKAEQLLDKAGWEISNGKRVKGLTVLKLRLVTLKEREYQKVAEEIKSQWQRLGIEVEIQAVDLAELIQSHIKPRQFDMLLFGITIGADPDVYPYWHSSQRSDPGLNLSRYRSPAADAPLEVARITVDPDIRAGKYQAFLKVFQQDAPAVILYAKDYSYGVNTDVLGQQPGLLASPADRFYGVENWTVHAKRTILK